MKKLLLRSAVCCVLFCIVTGVNAAEWFVAPGANGNGNIANPFRTIQEAIDIAQPGDTITLQAGTYQEALRSRRNGSANSPVTLRAQNNAAVIITSTERVLDVQHAYFIVDGIVFDGQYGSPNNDTIRVRSTADFFILRNSEVRRSGRNCINMDTDPGDALQGVIIENNLIRHCLRYDPILGRQDAHGIVAGAVRDLLIRDTEIHTFSGDAIQIDPDRDLPGWDSVNIEHSHFWLAPLTTAENGFPVNTIPGENAVDVKVNNTTRAGLTLRDVIAHGFRNETLNNGNVEAFLLRENLDLLIDGVTVYDSTVAFRLRGPNSSVGNPDITIQNAVIYDVREAFRYDGDIAHLHLYNSTVGTGIGEAFRQVEAGSITVRNSLFSADTLPAEAASDNSNLAVNTSVFVNVAQHDYRLQQTAVAINNGVFISNVMRDRDGNPRPQESVFDMGAYESCFSCIFASGFD